MKRGMSQEAVFWVALAAISLFGAIFRLANLSALPAGVYLDEAANLMDGLQNAGEFPFALFYSDVYERGLTQEGLFTNLQILAVQVLGPSVAALRLPAALAGTVAIVGIGWMAREALQSRAGGLVAAALVASAYWPLNFSRIAFSAALLPAVLAPATAALLVAVRRRSVGWSAVSGALFALTLYTYAASRVVPVFLAVVGVFLVLSKWPFNSHRKFQVITFFTTFVAAASPFVVGLLRSPGALTRRAQSVSIQWTGDVPTFLGEVMENLGFALGKHLFFADPNYRHGFPPFPVLDYATGVFFVGGTLLCVCTLLSRRHALIYPSMRVDRVLGGVILLSGLLVFLIPEVLSNDSNPHALRSIGTMPYVFALAAWGLLALARSIERLSSRVMTRMVMGLVLAAIVAANVTQYFVLFARSESAQEAFGTSLTSFAESVAMSACSEVEIQGVPRPEQAVVDFFLIDSSVKVSFSSAESPTRAVRCLD